MPVIESVPTDHFDSQDMEQFKKAMADRRLESLRFPQVLAYSTRQLHGSALGYASDPTPLLSTRLRELMRIRSAQLGGCAGCSAARYDDSVGDSTAACLMTDYSELDDAERLVMRFVTLMHTDHDAIDASLYLELSMHFSIAQIIEIGVITGRMLGSHRFIHTLDLLGTDEPVLKFDPQEIDAVYPAANRGALT